MRTCVVDFETEPIGPRPYHYPPKPVGVALHADGVSRYHAWGHASDNSTTVEAARRRLRTYWRDPRYRILFHHAQFDLDVAETWMGLPWLPVDRWRCTMIRAFLFDPNALRMGLKELSEDLLDEPPEERDILHEWLVEHIPHLKRLKPARAAEHIALAPGSVAGLYAKGDTSRTLGLDRFYRTADPTPGDYAVAEDRLQRATRMFVEMSREGIPIDDHRLRQALPEWEAQLDRHDQNLRKLLGVTDLDFDKREQLADALEDAGYELPTTSKGARQTNITVLQDLLDSPELDAFLYRAKLRTSLRSFGRPWAALDSMTLHPNWSPTKRPDASRGLAGARTGRPSSSPNLQNVPKRRPVVTAGQKKAAAIRATGTDAYWLPFARPLAAWQLPNPRDFIAAPRGFVLCDADYRQQELRILAHYTGGDLLKAYQEDPEYDLHEWARQRILTQFGILYPRGHCKIARFADIYGQGAKGCAQQLRIPLVDASKFKRQLRSTTPGVEDLRTELHRRADEGEPFYTWGGRPNFCEDDIITEEGRRSFEYKMLNTLVQGSAADQMIEAMLRYHEHPKRKRLEARILLTVHDQLLTLAPRKAVKENLALQREAMESTKFDLDMPVDMQTSSETWARLEAV